MHSFFLPQGGHMGLGEQWRRPSEPLWGVLCRLCLVEARGRCMEVEVGIS